MRSEKEIFERARQDRRSDASICAISRSCSLNRISLTFSTRFSTAASLKEGGPIGLPKRTKPSPVVEISDGRGFTGPSSSAEM